MNLIVNESMTMSSREISELTGKRHDNVRADIQKMGEELSLIFQEKPEHSGGRPVMAYHLGKRECLILISGYSLELRARIIDRWQELEQAASQPSSLPRRLPAPRRGFRSATLPRRWAWVRSSCSTCSARCGS